MVAIHAKAPDAIEFGDAGDYLAAARSVCVDGMYPEKGNLPFFRAPGLPLFIAAVTGCDVANVHLAKIGLAVADSFLPVLLFFMGLRLFGRDSAGMIAALGGAFHPILVVQVTDIRSEPLFTLFLTAALALFLIALRRPQLVLLFGAGLSVALTALVRPVGLAAYPLLVVAWLSFARSRRAIGALLLLGGGVVLAPWTAYLGARYGELILINDAGGYNLWRGAHPDLFGALTASDRDAYVSRTREFELETSPREAESVERVASSPGERSRAWRERAMETIRENPRGYAQFTGWKAARFWQPWLNPHEYSRAVVIASGAWNVVLYALALAGLVILVRHDRATALLLTGWVVVFWLAHIPFQVVARFRVASIDPVLLVLAAGSIDAILLGLLGWHRRPVLHPPVPSPRERVSGASGAPAERQ